MTFEVTIDRQVTAVSGGGATQPVRVRMEVTGVVGFADFGIFTYIKQSVTDLPVFSHVATATDLQDYLLDTFGNEDFQRKAVLDEVYDTPELADEAVAALEARVKMLCEHMELLDTFSTSTTVVISS